MKQILIAAALLFATDGAFAQNTHGQNSVGQMNTDTRNNQSAGTRTKTKTKGHHTKTRTITNSNLDNNGNNTNTHFNGQHTTTPANNMKNNK